MEEKRTAEGAIWDAGDTISVAIGEERFMAKRVTDKANDKYPDWKGDKVGVWDRTSKKGAKYRFIRLDDKTEFVAFKNRFPKTENEPHWKVFKSEKRE